MHLRSALASAVLAFALVSAPARAQHYRLTVLQTTDIHDHANGAGHVGLDAQEVNGRGALGSYARIAAYVNEVRRTTANPVILVDSGDFTMGTLYDLTLASQPLALYFLDLMKYDCVTLGNHEFDYSSRGLAAMLGAAQRSFGFHTPIVASNMSLGGDADLAPFVGEGKAIQTTRVLDFPYVRVGFLGLMGEEAAIDAPLSAPVSFARLSTHYADIQAIVDDLRTRRGVQIVIALSHSGTDATGLHGEDVELARHVTGIDVIASGHSHTPLPGALAVENGTWTTQLVDAGAFGTNVARIDLTYQLATGSTYVRESSNLAMTDEVLAGMGLQPDIGVTPAVFFADLALNAQLAPLLSKTFPDYRSDSLDKGIYHPVAAAAQDMVSNDKNPVLCPNGLGDLAADAVRGVPNDIIAKTLAAVVGGNPANLPGYDFTPVQAGIVATGVLRGGFPASAPITFADVYDLLPLGISPDVSQALPVGYPLVAGYLDLADVKKACALQLVAQTNLVSSQFYLNLSGIRYSLKEAETYAFFKHVTAAGVLQVTSGKAAAGSVAALQALGALSRLGTDSGAALLGLYAGGNPYAAAMVKLNDANPGQAEIAASLGALGQVAAAAAADAAAGTSTLPALLVSKAVDAVDVVEGFAPTDAASVGAAAAITAPRVRVVGDLYAILLLGAVRAKFGVELTLWQSASGNVALSAADMATLLGNRVDADPAAPGVQELKEWMAVLGYVGSGLHGAIPPAYASTAMFTDFPSFGPAVTTRNASYPIASVGRLVGTLGALAAAP